MNETSSRYLHCLLAASMCLSTVGVGCASSNDAIQPDADEQVSSAPDYESTADEDENTSTTQSGSMNTPEPGSSMTGKETSISDAELEEFGAINREMKKLQEEARRKMQGAESRAKAQSVKKDVQKKVQKVFEDHSMSRERYEEIGRTVRDSPELQKRYRNLLDSESSK